MKNKNAIFALILAVMAGFASGCNDLTTPQGVLATAWSTLQKEKIHAFKRTLRGEAKEHYGDLVGMAKLYEEIRGLELTAGDSALVRTELDSRGKDSLRVFDIEILARPRLGGDQKPELGTGTYMPFKTAEVQCDIDYVVVGGDHWQTYCHVDGRIPECEHFPAPWTGGLPPAEREVSRCWVTSLRSATF